MEIKHLNDQNFKETTNKENYTLIDFFATWCGPCKMMAPILERAQEELEGINIYKVDVDESDKTAREFGVMSIPTLVLLKNGNEVARNVGLINQNDLVAFVKKYR